MSKMHDVYQMFGEVSELTQLLETELGTLLISTFEVNPERVAENPELAWLFVDDAYQEAFHHFVSSKKVKGDKTKIIQTLNEAFVAQHRLRHCFFRDHHNNDVHEMLTALNDISLVLLNGYQAVLRLSGIEIEGKATQNVSAFKAD